MPKLIIDREDKCDYEGCEANATIAGVRRNDYIMVKAGCPDHWKDMGVLDRYWVIVGMSEVAAVQEVIIAEDQVRRRLGPEKPHGR